MNTRIVIIDDEQHCIDTLQWQLETYVNDATVEAVFRSSKSALSYLQKNKVDLVFLDIEMPEMNGFQLVKQLEPIRFDLIFATAYDEFAVQAFKTSALDYLLKPIDKSDLLKAMEKVRGKKEPSRYPEQMELLFSMMKQGSLSDERMALPTQAGLQFVSIKDIMYCISDSNYTRVHLLGGTSHLVSRTLKEIEALLPLQQFLRIHHSHLINTQKISQYVRGDGGYVVMDDGKSLSVSRSRKDALLRKFGS
ncbi:MAG TPA: LytTR family DNA-binding domain-containing protein [Flavobacteriaceae bacterium]|nr:response regulator transcription factor [Flavobacteriaceae bacterium]HPF10790.1 LytTR family DNA-binding domain-containing protein [Flavobacteriaceae bacterium]HQU21001.1 LytTR family DNA-binding domain-containing protein [Flavobacteriaceae bacterium]HQU65471.1 LytTR family DNA-binding domain-containing protein [Flavobacteriaceae bacterium]HRW44553.1 LytTR family DNA-binding domain-containing protein [Flavobacteriaceae bacterium]